MSTVIGFTVRMIVEPDCEDAWRLLVREIEATVETQLGFKYGARAIQFSKEFAHQEEQAT